MLKEVDTTESVYTRTLVKLKDASLPDGVDWAAFIENLPAFISWDLFLTLKYRQDWRPSGYGLGELLYAVSLLPNEELTLEIKTWETSKTQQDTEDTTDVRNVSDLKTASSNTNEITTEENTKKHEYVDAKAGYSGFGFSASVEAGWSQDVSDMQKNFAKQTQERSQQATNEYRSSRKVKMAVSRESGSESKTTRKIKNINQAHTLNVNYYEVLREFDVKLALYDVTLVLLGAEPNLNSVTLGTEGGIYNTWDTDPSKPISLGQIIRFSRSSAWVQAFTDKHGVSPIKLLREEWGLPLYNAAPLTADWSESIHITPEEREVFQTTVLQYVRPTAGWIEPDEKGALRWGYEIIAGQEKALLEYLYKFLPYSAKQMVAKAMLANVEPARAYQSVAARYVQMTIPSPYRRVRATFQQKALSPTLQVAAVAEPFKMAKTDKILVRGPFYGRQIKDFIDEIPAWVKNIVSQLENVRGTIGVIKTDDKESWKATLPTQGIYSDLALGVCSGAEDFYEIQRQFDLELKKMEIEKLKAELETLKLEKRLLEQGKSLSSVTITNPPDQTAVNLGITVGKTPADVEFKKTT